MKKKNLRIVDAGKIFSVQKRPIPWLFKNLWVQVKRKPNDRGFDFYHETIEKARETVDWHVAGRPHVDLKYVVEKYD